MLEAEPVPSLAVRYHDLRGDVAAAAGDIDAARKAYQTALEAADAVAMAGDRSAEIIRVKRDALTGGSQ